MPRLCPVHHAGEVVRPDHVPSFPYQTFLADMRQNPSPSSLARKTWVKRNRTLVNRWKKNNVALYSPSNVRMLLCSDSTLFSYEAVLTPAPPARSASRESLVSAGRSHTSPAPPVEDVGDQDRSLPWSGFDDELPPNQEARPATPPAPTFQPPPEPAPGPSSQPLPTQPPSDLTLALLMNMMTTFQSEKKSLRSDLSGSVSSMMAEKVAAQLPQVLILIIGQALLFFVAQLLVLFSYILMTMLHPLLCTIVLYFFLGLSFIRPYPTRHRLRCLPRRPCPWPGNLPGCPNRDRRDSTAPRFWLDILLLRIVPT